jgi:DNA mismatch endonuclease (patch repair protein)
MLKKKKARSKEELRHYTMSRIKHKDTGIEIDFRKALWKEGIRYRKNYKLAFGTPDIAITRYKIAIFCDGEFWHGKNWDIKKNKIKSNKQYWDDKIERNIKRDVNVDIVLYGQGWIVLRFWGNEIKNSLDDCVWEVKEQIIASQMDGTL